MAAYGVKRGALILLQPVPHSTPYYSTLYHIQINKHGPNLTVCPLTAILRPRSELVLGFGRVSASAPPSSRGLGHRPFKPATGVRIPLGVPARPLHAWGGLLFAR